MALKKPTHDPDCPLCDGLGWFDDECYHQTIPCFLCRDIDDKPVEVPEWLQDCPRLSAKYFGRPFAQTPDLIVVHRGEGPGNIQLFFHNLNGKEEAKRSAHLVVENDGQIIQCVSLRSQAYHVGKQGNYRSLGIELRGPNDAPYPEPMIDSLVALCHRLHEVYPTLANICGHRFLNPANRRDPGGVFPWSRIRAELSYLICPDQSV